MKSRSDWQILVVEDDRFLRRACETSLRQMGFTVSAAIDGEEALQRIRKQPPHLILLDLLMPKITGIDLLRILKSDKTTRSIPVVILTNSSREGDIAEVKSMGVEDYLVKANLSLKELGSRVQQLLKE